MNGKVRKQEQKREKERIRESSKCLSYLPPEYSPPASLCISNMRCLAWHSLREEGRKERKEEKIVEIGRYWSNNGYMLTYVCSLLLYETHKEFLIGEYVRCCLWSFRCILTPLHPSLYFWDKKPVNCISQLAYEILPAGSTDGRIKGGRKGAAILFPSSGRQWQHREQRQWVTRASPDSGSAARL